MIRINLLPVREARRQASLRRQAIFLGVAVGLGILLCVALQISMNSRISGRQAMLATKNQELKRLEATQQEVKRFEREKADIEAKLSVITEIEKARIGPVKVMDTIATQIPKRVWLTSLNAKEGALEVQGRSLDAEVVAEFLTNLEATPMLNNLELQETQLKEIEGLKLNTFRFKGRYPHPKPVAAVKKGGKDGKSKKRRRNKRK